MSNSTTSTEKPTVEFLLKKGGDLNELLLNAALSCNDDMVMLAIAYGAKVHSESSDAFNKVVWMAVYKNCTQVVETLLENGADVNDLMEDFAMEYSTSEIAILIHDELDHHEVSNTDL